MPTSASKRLLDFAKRKLSSVIRLGSFSGAAAESRQDDQSKKKKHVGGEVVGMSIVLVTKTTLSHWTWMTEAIEANFLLTERREGVFS